MIASFFHGTLLLALLLALLLPRQDAGGTGPDFFERAQKLRQAANWAELEKAAREQAALDPEDGSAQGYLALALAGQQRYGESVAALKALEALGHSTEDSLAGLGKPMDEITSIIWDHCWANFDAEFNRRCWGELFDAWPDGSLATVAGTRLLMAARKLGDEQEAARIAAWFEARIAAAEDKPFTLRTLLAAYTKGLVLAEAGGERTLALAVRSFELAYAEAAAMNRYTPRAGPDPDEPPEDLLRRERCDVATDDEYNHLARAAVLSGAWEPANNPLAAREPAPGAVFEDVTVEAGLAGQRQSRVAVGDYDLDGDPDLCLQGALFRNEGGKRFTDVSEAAGLKGRGTSALFGDFDNDGDLDLLLPAVRPRLYRNEGKKEGYRFQDVTKEAGLEAMTLGAAPEGAAWTDVDGDGFLDFYLAAYEQPMSTGHPDLLARNRGDGTFEDVSQALGIHAREPRCGRGVAAADFDGDGDQDLYVSNYRLQKNLLFRNDGRSLVECAADFQLEGEADRSGDWFGHTIGSCFGDIDNDGDLDLFTANLAHPRFITQGFSNLSMLYVNGGPAEQFRFAEERRARGIRFQETHSDPAFADVDNDGDLDLSITAVYEGVPSALYQNDGRGFFQPVTFRSRAIVWNGWGQAWFDYDDDGDLDVLYASGGGVRLFRNQGNDNSWLKVVLQGRKRNRFAVGARVVVETIDHQEGERPLVQVRELQAGRGTSSQDDTVLHFGLGAYKGKVRIAVTWPDTGATERKASFINRTLTVKQVKA